MNYYDPTGDTEDIKASAIQAALLRKIQAPEGQMVSGHYIKPSMGQQLAPLLGGVLADYQDNQNREKTKDVAVRSQEALASWLRNRPTEQTTYGAGEQGPTMTTTPPTEQQTVDWAGQGAALPQAKALANNVLSDTIVNAPIRAEKSADKRYTTDQSNLRFAEDRDSRDKNLLLQLTSRSQDLASKLENQTQLGQATNATRQALTDTQLQIAQLKSASAERIQGMKGEAAVDAAGAKATAAGEKPIKLSSKQENDINKYQDEAKVHNRLLDSFKDEYSGLKHPRAIAAATFGDKSSNPKDQEVFQFWSTLRNDDNVLRNGLFGSALTATEKAAWKSTTVSPASDPAAVRALIERRRAIVIEKYNQRLEIIKGGANVLQPMDATGRMASPPVKSALPRATGRSAAPQEQATSSFVGTPEEVLAAIDAMPESKAVKDEAKAAYARQTLAGKPVTPAENKGWSVKRLD